MNKIWVWRIIHQRRILEECHEKERSKQKLMVGRHDNDRVSVCVSNHCLQERKITFGKLFKSIFLLLKRNWDCLVFSKGKSTIYNNYKCFMGKQWMDKAIRKGSTWERTKRVIPELRFTFISSCFLIAIC